MPPTSTFAPYRLAPGSLPEEGSRAARLVGAGPLVVGTDQPLAQPLKAVAFASIEAGLAAGEAEACRGADGALAGNPAAPRACLTGERHLLSVAAAVQAALEAGYAGAVLERPDAPLVEGLLGAGFCAECQREFQRRLARKYGEPFQPIDYLAMARSAVAGASSALSFATLPFGRDFWRFRHESLERAVRAYVRGARDAVRVADRPFPLCGRFAALGPSQLAAARHLDAAVFPVTLSGYPVTGRFELLRGALQQRAVAVEMPADAPPAAWLRLASLGAPYGIGVAGLQPGREAGAVLAGIRTLARGVAARGGAPSVAAPMVEVGVLYSAEADVWSGGRHRRAVETALEALIHRQLQVTVTLRPSELAPGVPLVLAEAEALSRVEAHEVARRKAAGAPLLTFSGPGDEAAFAKAVDALLPAERRAVRVSGAAHLVTAIRAHKKVVDIHLAAAWPERVSKARLRLPVLVTRGARKGRFAMSDGTEVKLRFDRSGEAAVSVELPTFTGYAVLTPET
jgi:hypothetical protein